MAVLFYTENGIISSTRTARIQEEIDVLKGMFDRVGIQTNFNTTVSMVCHPCYMDGRHSEVAYTRRIVGVGLSFR